MGPGPELRPHPQLRVFVVHGLHGTSSGRERGAHDHAAFAEEIKRAGRRYFVQTPNRAFPLEPHVMMPLVNYLPKRWQRRLYRNFTLWGWLARPDQSYVDWFVEDTNLLGRREMERLFPGARLASGRSLVSMR